MKYLKKFGIPVFIILLTITLLLVAKHSPSGKLWDGYSVFYIENTASDSYVSEIFENFGCEGVVSDFNQKIPLDVSENTPEYALLFSGVENSDYLSKRSDYFFDKGKDFKVFYVPEDFSSNLFDAVDYIQNTSEFSCGVDASATFPVLPVILVLIFAGILIWKSEKRFLFAISAVLPVFFCFMLPYYSGIACICLILLGISVSLKMWNRTGGLHRLFKIRMLQILFGAAVIISFLTGIINGLLFVLLLLSLGSIFYLYKIFEDKKYSRYSFKPVQIRSARMISLASKNAVFSILCCAAVIIFLIIFSVFSVNIGSASGSEKLMLPANHGKGKLPDLNDYSKWRWEAMTFPYVSLNNWQSLSNPKKGDSVHFSTYKDNPDSIEEVVSVLTYDDSFIENGLEYIDSLDYPAIEKLMKSQGLNFSAGYSSSGSQNVTIFTIILLILSLSVPVLFYLLCYKKVK